MGSDKAPRKQATETSTDSSAPSNVPGLGVTFNRAELTKVLARLKHVSDPRSTIPILANVAIRADRRGVTLIATDLDVFATVRMETPLVRGEGALTVSTKALHDLARSLPGEDLTLSSGGTWCTITSGATTARLDARPDKDFPKVPSTDLEYPKAWATLDASILAGMIESVAFSVCKDSTRFHLNGAYLHSEGNSTILVSTDGHRLTKAQRVDAGSLHLDRGVIIQSKGLTEIKRAIGKGKGLCDVAVSDGRILVRYAGTTIAARITDAQFPPYEQVIPKDYTRRVTVDRKTLASAVARAGKVSGKFRGIALAFFDGSLVVTGDNPDTGETRETIDADHNVRDFRIGVSPSYLGEALDAIDEERVTITLGTELSPVIVRGANDARCRVESSSLVTVVMPMRI